MWKCNVYETRARNDGRGVRESDSECRNWDMIGGRCGLCEIRLEGFRLSFGVFFVFWMLDVAFGLARLFYRRGRRA